MRVASMLIAVAAAAAAGPVAAAPPDAKAGLWERTVTRQMEGPPVAPVADPSRLAPEQRARVDQMMSARSTTAPTTDVVRYCVTPEAARSWDTFAREERDLSRCGQSVQDETPRALKRSLVCGGGSETGTVDFAAIGADRIRGTITMVRHEAYGDRTVRIDVDSRWLSPDCGAVKPDAPARGKG